MRYHGGSVFDKHWPRDFPNWFFCDKVQNKAGSGLGLSVSWLVTPASFTLTNSKALLSLRGTHVSV